MGYNKNDFYFKKAKSENYLARSVYKLQEIDEKYRIFKNGQTIIDLGASPGSWSQYASKKIGPSGKILGIDLTPMDLSLNNAIFITGDIETVDFSQILKENNVAVPVDIVMSDMAPKTTGIKSADQARSAALCEMALYVAVNNLKAGGCFVCKLFHSNDFETLRNSMRKNFKTVTALKPKGTRQESKEIFLIGLGFHS